MSDVNRSRNAPGLDNLKFSPPNKAILTPEIRNNFYYYFYKLFLLSCAAMFIVSFEFILFISEKNVPVSVIVLLFTEWVFFLSIRRGGRRSSDCGFVHDLFWAAMAPLLAIYAREGFTLTAEEVHGSTIYVAASFCAAVCVFPMFSMRQQLWGYTAVPELVRTGCAILLNVVLVTFIVFIVNRHVGVARTVPMLHLLFLMAPLLGLRIYFRFLKAQVDAQDSRATAEMKIGELAVRPEYVILIGVNRLSEFYINMIDELGDGSVEVIGLVSDEAEQYGCQIRSVPVVGTPTELRKILYDFDSRGVNADRIILCCSWQQLPVAAQRAFLEVKAQRRIHIHQLEDRVTALNKLFGFRRESSALQHSLLADSYCRHNTATDPQIYHERVEKSAKRNAQAVQFSSYFKTKRIFDILTAVLLLVFFSPVMLVVAIMVSATIGFPGIFWQKRPGRGGKVFRIYKFRTMLAPFDQNGNRVPEAYRTTKLCSLLRRSRLDELPQLFNILMGDMSLIGPRPLLPVDQPKDASIRLLIRPGVTGWAQVNGGIDLTPEEKLALDLWYARHASLWLDIKIIYKSIVMVIRGDRKNNKAIGEAIAELAVFGTNAV